MFQMGLTNAVIQPKQHNMYSSYTYLLHLLLL